MLFLPDALEPQLQKVNRSTKRREQLRPVLLRATPYKPSSSRRCSLVKSFDIWRFVNSSSKIKQQLTWTWKNEICGGSETHVCWSFVAFSLITNASGRISFQQIMAEHVELRHL
jgi:hypothetical protein